MIILSRALLLVGLTAASPAWAVYAPVPTPEEGKINVSARAGISHDSNLFGSASGEVASTIFTFAPQASFNLSLTEKTFASASYGLILDRFDNRPGDDLLDSHDLSVRLAHAFTQTTTVDVFNALTISRNPESLLNGVPLNPDQSFLRNQIDGRFTTPLHPKVSATFKARSVYYDYRNAVLGRSLDRIENIYGASAEFAYLPETKLVGEYRRQEVFYRKQGESKNKVSDYLMAGFDYEVARKLSVSGRAGAEWRSRKAEAGTTSPYVELSGKYDYAPKSFLVGGYAYTLEETSDLVRFTDTKVNRFFANVQHAVTALVFASGSFTYEPSQLQGRRGFADVDEETFRLGVALSYLPSKNWTVSGSFDVDRTDSDDAVRDLRRQRWALNATYAF